MFILELLLELLVELIMDCWFSLMQWIVPKRTFSKGSRKALKILVSTFTCILLFSMILGVFALISDDPYTKQIGRYLVFVPLIISAVQIILGILVRVISKEK